MRPLAPETHQPLKLKTGIVRGCWKGCRVGPNEKRGFPRWRETPKITSAAERTLTSTPLRALEPESISKTSEVRERFQNAVFLHDATHGI